MVGGTLQDDEIPRLQERLADQVEALLGAVGDQDVRWVGRQAVLGAVSICYVLAQGQIALGGGVLKGAGAIFGQHLPGRLGDLPYREEGRIGDTPGEGDDRRILGHGEYLGDERSVDPAHPARELSAHELFFLTEDVL